MHWVVKLSRPLKSAIGAGFLTGGVGAARGIRGVLCPWLSSFSHAITRLRAVSLADSTITLGTTMHRRAVAILLTVLSSCCAILVQAGDDDAQKALALQKVMQKVIAQVEPSVACILVSRSEMYQSLGLGPDKDHPGALGDFDPDILRSKPGLSKDAPLWKRRLDLA